MYLIKTIKLKSESNHPKSLTHVQYEKSIRINHTIENPIFFDVDKIFNDYITNHYRKFDLYFVKCDFKLVFNNFTPHIKTYFYHNTTITKLKRFLLYWINYFTERGLKFSHKPNEY